MEFGITTAADVTKIHRADRAEQLGYSQIWYADNPMLYSELFATMALAAQSTQKIKIGAGVVVAGLRLPHVAAAGFATINRIAPGRVCVAIGSGYSSYRDLGHVRPVKYQALKKYIQVMQALLSNEEAWFEYEGKSNPIKWLMSEFEMINVEHRIPLYLGASGPLGQRLAGEIADGLFDGWGPMAALPMAQENLRVGAERANRRYEDLAVWGPSSIVVLEPGEDLTSERVIDEAGIFVAIVLHALYLQFADTPADEVPPFIAPFWDDYCAMMRSWQDPERFHYRANAGHGVFVLPEERRFITPELISMFCAVGRPEELLEQIHDWENAGVTHVNLFADRNNGDRRMEVFAEKVIAKY